MNSFSDYLIGASAILVIWFLRSRREGDVFYIRGIMRLLGLRD